MAMPWPAYAAPAAAAGRVGRRSTGRAPHRAMMARMQTWIMHRAPRRNARSGGGSARETPRFESAGRPRLAPCRPLFYRTRCFLSNAPTRMPLALVVEDDANSLSALAELVEREGFAVDTAATLGAAREFLSGNVPDLLLVDLMLPDGSSMDLLKDMEAGASPEVVVITGHASVDTAVEALRMGASDYLTKPLDIPRLQDRSRQRRAHPRAEGRDRYAARRAAQAGALRTADRRLAADGPRLRSHRARGPHRRDGADHRRERAPARSWRRRRSTSSAAAARRRSSRSTAARCLRT